MGWSGHVRNYTKAVFSISPYKYGRADLKSILHDNPTWDDSDVIVGGGPEDEYILINGGETHSIVNEWVNCIATGTRAVVNYDIIPVPSDYKVTRCLCEDLVSKYGNVVAQKVNGKYVVTDEPLVHCMSCHNVWDGCAQCLCTS